MSLEAGDVIQGAWNVEQVIGLEQHRVIFFWSMDKK
ncbi:hypothetical protein VP01_5356g2 [Puccinia sorghi]|uniref:Uncharacterized protein n=1 Tax=Puccinia sorghi TaxID=27349 RepID=A0A0L6UK18_9BASI|nr:hypothetical protein VP01_5356g2 [Puccinia sorghi]